MMGCGHNLIDIYIFELSYFRDYYVKAYMEFCEDIASTCLPYAKKIKMLKAQHKDENDFQEFANYIDLQYNCLSGFLQNLVSFWENQLNDYCCCKDYNNQKYFENMNNLLHYFATEEGQREFAAWQAERQQRQLNKKLNKEKESR